MSAQSPAASPAVSSSAITALFAGSDEFLVASLRLLVLPVEERKIEVIKYLLELSSRRRKSVPPISRIVEASVLSFERVEDQTDFLKKVAEITPEPAYWISELQVTVGLTVFTRMRIIYDAEEAILVAYAQLLAKADEIPAEALSRYWGMPPTSRNTIEKIGKEISTGFDEHDTGRQMLSVLDYVSQVGGVSMKQLLGEIVTDFLHKAIHRMKPVEAFGLFREVQLRTFPFQVD